MTDARERAVMMALFDIEKGHEDEFNRWYEEEHFPERMLCPGFRTGRRFKLVTGGEGKVTPERGFEETGTIQKYLTIYDIDNVNVLETDAYRAVKEPSAWTKRIYQHWERPARAVYVEMPRPKGIVFNGRKP